MEHRMTDRYVIEVFTRYGSLAKYTKHTSRQATEAVANLLAMRHIDDLMITGISVSIQLAN